MKTIIVLFTWSIGSLFCATLTPKTVPFSSVHQAKILNETADNIKKMMDHVEYTILPNKSNQSKSKELLHDTVHFHENAFDRAEALSNLLDHGADVNAQDDQGNTALHLVVQKKDMLSAKALIDRGADVSITNHQGLGALDYAVNNKDEKMLRYLLDHFPKNKLDELLHFHDRLTDAAYQHVKKINALEAKKVVYKYPLWNKKSAERDVEQEEIQHHTQEMNSYHRMQALVKDVPGFHEASFKRTAREMNFSEQEADAMYRMR